METRLQSNEVRLPKNDRLNQSSSAFKSSFARSLSFSCQNKPLDLENGYRSPNLDTTPPTKDDDFEEFMKHSPLKKALQAKQLFTTPIKGRPLVSATMTSTSQSCRLQVNWKFSSFFFLVFLKWQDGGYCAYFTLWKNYAWSDIGKPFRRVRRHGLLWVFFILRFLNHYNKSRWWTQVDNGDQISVVTVKKKELLHCPIIYVAIHPVSTFFFYFSFRQINNCVDRISGKWEIIDLCVLSVHFVYHSPPIRTE